MISLRQHVVTIVAIFLALALGVLAGSAFVQPRLIESLETQVDEQRQRITELQDEVDQARDQLGAEQAFNDVALPHLTQDRLMGLDVVVLAQEGVEDEVVAETRGALEQSGASVVTLEARTSLAPQDEEGRAALAEVLTLTEPAPEEL
ncbi:MAG TPA: copper transporter, partial [Actinomycetota bacterium]|nr:copper transporter [Actinomycetota bacterium]